MIIRNILLALVLLVGVSCTSKQPPEKYVEEIVKAKQPSEEVVKAFSKRDLECLARNSYHEARGEGIKGMRLVADVVMNRVKSPKYPNTICKVVYQKSQFSWTRGERKAILDPESYEKAKKVAEKVIQREKDHSKGALYFHSVSVRPSWSYHRKRVISHGRHRFYK